MALVNCPECNRQISNHTSECPKCGYILNKPKRGFFGKIFKWSFILFNLLMITWLIGGVGEAMETTANLTNEYEQAGAALGTALGAGMIVSIWLVGDIILGMFVFFTIPKVK